MTPRGLGAAPALALAAGCGGPQSTLPGAGIESSEIATLLLTMLAGSVGIVALVAGAAIVALIGTSAWRRRVASDRLVVWGGIALPVVVLTALLVYGFVLLDRQTPEATGEALEIEVVGEQWWWRVRYRAADGTVVETANELRLPIDRPVELELTSADVIHSFWIPALGGKLDMIPGHVNTLRLTPTRPGVFRGQCAEYCGGPHALMSFYVVVDSAASFADWLRAQRADATTGVAGIEAFLGNGCGGCHAIRGTAAAGTIGPDLTHVGGRLSIGAGVLRTSPDAFAEWLRQHHAIKPGNRMPPFEALPPDDVAQLAAYLASLD